jgi:hypothetical protein
LVSWLLILLPSSLLAFIGIDIVRTTYFSIIGSVSFLASALLIFWLLYKLFDLVTQKRSAHRERYQRHELLSKLTPVEHQYLSKYIDNQSQTATFTVYDGVVAGLIDKGILYKPNSHTNRAGEQDYNIHSWAYDYLNTRTNSTKASIK